MTLAVLLVTFAVTAPAVAQRLPDAVCATLRSERAKLQTPPGNPGLGAALNATAWTHRATGWGLSRKESGNRCPSKAGNIACDVLMLADGSYWDVFRDSDGAATVNCGSKAGTITDPKRAWVAPADPGTTPPPPPQPPPSTSLEARVAVLEQQNQAQALALAILQRDVQALLQRVTVLEQQPPGGACQPHNAETSRTWGHSHTVTTCTP